MPLKLPSLAFLANETVKKAVSEIAVLSISGMVCVVGSTLVVNKLAAPKAPHAAATAEVEPKAEKKEEHAAAPEKEEKKEAKPEAKEGGEGHGAPKGEGHEAKAGSSGNHVALKSVIVNLADTPARRYAKVTFTLDVKDSKVKDLIESHEPQVYDTLIKVVSNYRFDEVNTSAGKEALKDEVRNRLNLVLSDGLSNVYLTEMIVQ